MSYQTVDYYLRQPYSRAVFFDAESGTYVGKVFEFPGCITQGDTPDQTYDNLDGAARGWLEAAIDMGQTIPTPDPWAGWKQLFDSKPVEYGTKPSTKRLASIESLCLSLVEHSLRNGESGMAHDLLNVYRLLLLVLKDKKDLEGN